MRKNLALAIFTVFSVACGSLPNANTMSDMETDAESDAKANKSWCGMVGQPCCPGMELDSGKGWIGTCQAGLVCLDNQYCVPSS